MAGLLATPRPAATDVPAPTIAGAGAGGGTGERWGAGIAGSRPRSLRPIGWAEELPSPHGLRTYPRAPLALSIVDSVAFGRDIDFSGESYFDEDFKDLFRNCAGSASWEQASQGTTGGIRTYSNCPGQQSLVRQVAFPGKIVANGRGGGASDATELAEAMEFAEDSNGGQDFTSMFKDSAGLPSWAKSPRRGLKQFDSPNSTSRPGENELPPEWKRKAPASKPTPRAPRVPLQPTPRSRSLSQRPSGRVMVSHGQSVIINSSRHR